ncbi:TlpA family protein disulfide reductase [Winogradskyella sp.]
MQRIDTFAQDGTVWNNSGSALIEKDKNDKVFGFSFYGKRDDIDKEYIYDAGNGFEISKTDKTYEVEPGHFGFIGSPGGQMVHPNIFRLDSIYKDVSVSETENSYLLSFEFENDTVYNVSDRTKIYELNKTNFFPVQIKQTSSQLGNKSVSIAKFSDVKINENVTNSIKDLKQDFQDYSIIQPEKREPNKLLLKKLPTLELPDLFDKNKIVKINSNKLTLIDFWEVWCGPCITSFSKVENLKNKFASELNVFGIVSEDHENAIKFVKKKGTTFQNLIGNNDLEKQFSVYSWPRYFLVDKNGIVQKEYFGFSDEIEKDIKEYTSK